jgi:hypothetical protein
MKLKINELQSNISNPRLIKQNKFEKLVKSIKEFPQMLELRPIVIDENNVILGGNMRYKACVEAGLKEVPVKIAKGLTEEQKQEFIVKDNVGFGEWDWDILGNEWDNVKLGEWGMDLWNPDKDNEWNGSDNLKDTDMLDGYLNKETGVLKISYLQDDFKTVVNQLNEITEKENFQDFSQTLNYLIKFYNEHKRD